jgi:hypothetical protein
MINKVLLSFSLLNGDISGVQKRGENVTDLHLADQPSFLYDACLGIGTMHAIPA